jgi:DNA-binding NarL/FixJ family response regulator
VTRVLVVDDHPIFRDGLARLLATQGDIEEVLTASTAQEAFDRVRGGAVDVALMDINMPATTGVEATRVLHREAPNLAVLMVTMVDDDDSVDAALDAGARGYVLKDAEADEILAAVRTVAAGGVVLGAGVATRLLTGMHERPDRPDFTPAGPLTPRENEILQLVAQGASNRQIARQLALSLKTVQNHVSRILDKTQASSRTDAALRARGL